MSSLEHGSRTVGIVGAGLMGRGIAQITAQAGFDVLLFDSKAGAADDARKSIADTLATLAAKGKIDAASAERAIAHICLPATIDALAAAGLVIEAIVERLDAKQALFKALEAVVSESCILATNTSSLSVTAIAAACAKPARVAGMHFFSPVPLMKVVEVIDGVLTAPDVVSRLVDFARALGHTPVRAKDTPGFIVNHAGRGYGTEALRIVAEGIAGFEAVDRILKRAAGFRMGPFELLDLTGLDVSHPVMESIYHQFYGEPRFRPSPLTAQRLAAGLLGRKSGRGFYDYSAKEPTPAVDSASNASAARRVWISAKEAQARPCVAELVRALGAEVVEAKSPPGDVVCLVLPLGRDATTAALDEALDPVRTIALDTLFGVGTQRTLMKTPLTSAETSASARALFAADGASVDVIHDSPGFVAQRVMAHIVNIACDIAQQRIASPADVDLAVRIGLGYPKGPLAWGDSLDPARILRILEEMLRAYGDPRYRVSPWLSRRARLGVSLLTPES